MSQKILKNHVKKDSSPQWSANFVDVVSLSQDVAAHTIAIQSLDRKCSKNLSAHEILYKDYHQFQTFLFSQHEGTVKVFKKLRKDLNTLTSIVTLIGILTLLCIFLTMLSLFS